MSGDTVAGRTPFHFGVKDLAQKSKNQGVNNIVTAAKEGLKGMVHGGLPGVAYGFCRIMQHDFKLTVSPYLSGIFGDSKVVCETAGNVAGFAAASFANTGMWLKSLISDDYSFLDKNLGPYAYGTTFYYKSVNNCKDSGAFHPLFRLTNAVGPIFNHYSTPIILGASAAFLVYSITKMMQLKVQEAECKGQLFAKIQKEFFQASIALREEQNHHLAPRILENMNRLKLEIQQLDSGLNETDILFATKPLRDAARELVG